MNAKPLQLRRCCRRAALTLLEMMVAVTLLALIMVGLLAMFNQTQKALHIVNAQSDVFENARGAIQMLSRDISEMTAFGETSVTNFHFAQVPFAGVDILLPSNITVSNRFYEAFWLTRANDDWQGIGYFVEGAATSFGTLYRFSMSGRSYRAQEFLPAFFDSGVSGPFSNHVHRVSDGIVNFQVNAVYPDVDARTGVTNFFSVTAFDFTTNGLPAYVDVELGVVEPATLKQLQSLTSDSGFDQKVVDNFLRDHAGRIHYFRQRIPIRNFVNPYRSNEVP